MIIVLNRKITQEELKKIAEDLEGYIKFVVDIEKKVLAAGGLRHVDAEQELLKLGSKQENLWGGGWDLASNEIDYDSMVNIRPHQSNPSREVLSTEVRAKIDVIVKELLLS